MIKEQEIQRLAELWDVPIWAVEKAYEAYAILSRWRILPVRSHARTRHETGSQEIGLHAAWCRIKVTHLLEG